MKNRKRAIRRHHIARLKKARQYYWGYGNPHYQSGISEWIRPGVVVRELTWNPGVREMTPKQLGRVSQYPQTCSCLGCGNPRRYYGRSLAEARQLALFQDQLTELDQD